MSKNFQILFILIHFRIHPTFSTNSRSYYLSDKKEDSSESYANGETILERSSSSFCFRIFAK
ncbi:hypothetical protein LEP1GSC043_3801 [Leptospira weilii str. Ecochallenge]|uniref:Uncharacterized protein n=1 Tax=Leptospira weilii str. Ecochallenge TaxID=1049986 RepID=N1TZR2_9LEPT|nr:hypothetical protein LEP1GSC043_3801 [Leptospira weilii str. Ecochallenge]